MERDTTPDTTPTPTIYRLTPFPASNLTPGLYCIVAGDGRAAWVVLNVAEAMTLGTLADHVRAAELARGAHALVGNAPVLDVPVINLPDHPEQTAGAA